ncbi:MAG: type II secretion system protein [Patescibacteria group bacterium]|nr:type II secretion system protein [Patescibacteria group bacterium]
MKARQGGFTLIELLVVIAIISILSAVVLASLNSARKKGSDAAIQSNLDTIRTQAELYYGGVGGNKYGANAALESSCTATDNMFNDSNIRRAAAAAVATSGSVTCNVSALGTQYAVSAQLVSSSNYWCVDSTSVGKTESSALGTATVCP